MAGQQQHLPFDALSVLLACPKGHASPTKQALGLLNRKFQPSLPCRQVSDWRKDCSRVVGSCKSHFRGIKHYYLLAIVRSRIFKNGANAQNGAMQLWSDFGTAMAPGHFRAFLEVLTAITINAHGVASMTSVNQFWRRAKLPLAVSLASTLAGPAFGVSFNVGEIEGQFDSSLSVGASWSTQSPTRT